MGKYGVFTSRNLFLFCSYDITLVMDQNLEDSEKKVTSPGREGDDRATAIRQELAAANLIEADREVLLFNIRYALAQNFQHRPTRRQHFVEDDFTGWAKQVLAHMELTGVRFFKNKVTGNRHFKPERL